jgi:hypothetical protein
MHQGCDLLPRQPAATGDAEAYMESGLSLSADCQHASLATPCAAGCRLDLAVPTSCDDAMRSKDMDSRMWGAHSLHTAGTTIPLSFAFKPMV